MRIMKINTASVKCSLSLVIFIKVIKNNNKSSYIRIMEWYIKNRWWIWGITGVYLAYRIFLSIAY